MSHRLPIATQLWFTAALAIALPVVVVVAGVALAGAVHGQGRAWPAARQDAAAGDRTACSGERLIWRTAGGFELVPALVWRVEGADVADGLPESFDESGADTSQMDLERGESQFDGVQVGRVWRQEQEPGAALLQDRGGFRTLWLERLSRITKSPRDEVGASRVSTHVSKISRFIGRSMGQGAVRPSQRKPAMKVCVPRGRRAPWPAGAGRDGRDRAAGPSS